MESGIKFKAIKCLLRNFAIPNQTIFYFCIPGCVKVHLKPVLWYIINFQFVGAGSKMKIVIFVPKNRC